MGVYQQGRPSNRGRHVGKAPLRDIQGSRVIADMNRTQDVTRHQRPQARRPSPSNNTLLPTGGYAAALFILALSLFLLLPGCTRVEAPLKVGSNPWPGYETLYLARELGDLDETRIKLVEMPSASDVRQQLLDHNLDAGMLTLDEVVSLVSEGLDLRIILVMDLSDGADAVLAQPPIDSLDQLKGKRIGVELSAVGAVMLESLLEKAHLSRDEVQLVNLTVDRHAEAFRKGEVDAVVTFEPTRSQLLAEGARELFNSHQIPGRIIDVLAVRGDSLPAHHKDLHALVAAHFQALHRLRDAPGKALPLIAPRLGIGPEELRGIYQGLKLPDIQENHVWLDDGEARLVSRARQLANMMERWHLIERSPDLSNLIDSSYLTSP